MLQVLAIQGQADDQTTAYTALDLFPDTQIDIVWENPFFLFDEITAMFSLAFNVPSSPTNLNLFNFPDRIPVTGVKKKFKAMIKHSGLQIAFGEILLFMFDNDIQVQFVGTVEISKIPLAELDLQSHDFEVTDYSVIGLGTTPNQLDYSDAMWDGYISNALSKSILHEDFEYCIAPVKKADQEWDGHEALFGLKNSLLQYINFFNAKDKNFRIGNPDHGHTPVMPFLAVRSVIDKIFGDSLFENLFNDTDLNHLVFVLPGHHKYNNELYISNVNTETYPAFMNWYEHIEIKEYLLPINEHTLFTPLAVSSALGLVWQFNSFMPNYLANETIKDLFKVFGITLFRVGKLFVMEYNNTIFNRNVVVSWNDFLNNEPKIVREEPKNYVFGFEGEKATFDQTYGEYNTWSDVFVAASNAQTNVELFYKTQDNPQVLSITKTLRGIQNQVWLKVKSVKTALDTTSDSLYAESVNVTSSIKPLNMSIEKYWWQNHNFQTYGDDPNAILWGTPGDVLNKGHWHVPVVTQVNREAAPAIMFFAGRKPTFSALDSDPPLELEPPLLLTAERDPLNSNHVIISFADSNGFQQQEGFSYGYTIEYQFAPSSNWTVLIVLEPGVNWDVNDPMIEVTLPATGIADSDINIRVWAFSNNDTSPVAYIQVGGVPQVPESSGGFDGDEYPYLSNHHTDHFGNRIFDLSLIPDAPDSFIHKYHTIMREWVQSEKLRVNAEFNLSPYQLMKVDMRDKILLHGKLFFIEKVQFTLYPKHISKTEATLVSCPSIDAEGSN